MTPSSLSGCLTPQVSNRNRLDKGWNMFNSPWRRNWRDIRDSLKLLFYTLCFTRLQYQLHLDFIYHREHVSPRLSAFAFHRTVSTSNMKLDWDEIGFKNHYYYYSQFLPIHYLLKLLDLKEELGPSFFSSSFTIVKTQIYSNKVLKPQL